MILVTGASGLLGSNLVLTGKKTGRTMGTVTNRHRIRLSGVPDWQLDLTDAAAVRGLIRQAKPEVVIHCAAQTNLDAAETDPHGTACINVEVPRVLAAAAAEFGSQFVYPSTDAVFDGTRSMNVEGDPVRPLSVYGRTKYDGEVACAKANPGTLIARINIYGWNAQAKQSLAEWMLSKLEAGESFPGFTDVYFCPMLVNDFADVLFAMLDHRLSGIYHVCGSERISKYDFAARIARAFGLDDGKVQRASVHDSPLIAQRALDISMSTGRVTAAIGRPMPSVQQGLRRFAMLRETGFLSELKAMVGE